MKNLNPVKNWIMLQILILHPDDESLRSVTTTIYISHPYNKYKEDE